MKKMQKTKKIHIAALLGVLILGHGEDESAF